MVFVYVKLQVLYETRGKKFAINDVKRGLISVCFSLTFSFIICFYLKIVDIASRLMYCLVVC